MTHPPAQFTHLWVLRKSLTQSNFADVKIHNVIV